MAATMITHPDEGRVGKPAHRPHDQLLLLMLSGFASAFAVTTISPIQETLKASLALGDGQIGLLQGPALALPILLGALPLGLAIDQYRRTALILFFSVLQVAATILPALFGGFLVLLASRFVVGLSATAISTTIFSLLADIYPPDRRGRASMMIVIGQSLGVSAAFGFGGFLLDFPAGRDWRWLLLWLATPLGVAALSVLFLRDPLRTGSDEKAFGVAVALRRLWGVRRLMLILLAGFAATKIAHVAALTWTVPAFIRDLGLSMQDAAAAMAVVVLIGGVAGPLVGGFIADHCERTGGARLTMLALALLALSTLPLGCFGLVSDPLLAFALAALFMTMIFAILVAGITLFTVIMPAEIRGLSLSALSVAEVAFGLGLGPVTVPTTLSFLGEGAMVGMALAIACTACAVVQMILFLCGGRFCRRHA